MAYSKVRKVNLITRRGYSGIGAALGDVGDFFKQLLSSYGQAQQNAGAAAQAAADAQRASIMGGGGGIGFADVAILGGVGLAAYLLLFRKKS